MYQWRRNNVESPAGDQKDANPVSFPRKGHEGALKADGRRHQIAKPQRFFPFRW
jgi:hypothetical protein